MEPIATASIFSQREYRIEACVANIELRTWTTEREIKGRLLKIKE